MRTRGPFRATRHQSKVTFFARRAPQPLRTTTCKPSFAAVSADESEVPFESSYDGEEAPAPDRTWRSCYLMDYDPVNHLLVCIVCGEMQYPPNLTRVKAHIDEAHPDSLTMPPTERQQILEAWDEEVSRRERFFTSQLQRQSGILADSSKDDNRCSY